MNLMVDSMRGDFGVVRDKILEAARWNLEDSSEKMWNAMADGIRSILQELLEESKREKSDALDKAQREEGIL